MSLTDTDGFDGDDDGGDANDIDEDDKVAETSILPHGEEMQRLHLTFVSLIAIPRTHYHSRVSHSYSHHSYCRAYQSAIAHLNSISEYLTAGFNLEDKAQL